MGLLSRAVRGIRAYHGSPHSFDEFRLAKMGSGEGAQTYGPGLYFAEVEDVARLYRDKLTPAGQSGGMYEVRINADPNDFLDWDAPMSAQPKAFLDAIDDVTSWKTKRARGEDPLFKDYGYAFIQSLEGNKELSKSGVPGLRYLDEQSRKNGGGSRNYVLFDDSLIDVLRKYGLAGLMAMAGGATAGGGLLSRGGIMA